LVISCKKVSGGLPRWMSTAAAMREERPMPMWQWMTVAWPNDSIKCDSYWRHYSEYHFMGDW
jgi:hypothetical protein